MYPGSRTAGPHGDHLRNCQILSQVASPIFFLTSSQQAPNVSTSSLTLVRMFDLYVITILLGTNSIVLWLSPAPLKGASSHLLTGHMSIFCEGMSKRFVYLKKKNIYSQVWWYIPLIPAYGRLRQLYFCKFKAWYTQSLL